MIKYFGIGVGIIYSFKSLNKYDFLKFFAIQLLGVIVLSLFFADLK